jgi:eukaryotic-like serine/threonine-protein kinase
MSPKYNPGKSIILFFLVISLIASCVPATPVPVGKPTVIPVDASALARLGSTKVSVQDRALQVYIPAGQFPMGSEVGLTDEQPVHTVQLDAFWLDRTEVTNQMYRKCVEAGRCREPYDLTYYDDPQFSNHPVVYVSWVDAGNYCSFVDRRLPTEAEWEKAAIWNPVSNQKLVYPWGNEYDCSKANFDDETELDASLMQDGSLDCDGYELTAPVGSFPQGASPYGALDMGGNVWEWVHDAFIGVNPLDASLKNYYAVSRLRNPQGVNPAITPYRSLRGGSWDWIYGYGRSAYRLGFGKNDIFEGVGFRCAESSGFRLSGGFRNGR